MIRPARIINRVLTVWPKMNKSVLFCISPKKQTNQRNNYKQNKKNNNNNNNNNNLKEKEREREKKNTLIWGPQKRVFFLNDWYMIVKRKIPTVWVLGHMTLTRAPMINPSSPDHFPEHIFRRGVVAPPPHDYQCGRSYDPKFTTIV